MPLLVIHVQATDDVSDIIRILAEIEDQIDSIRINSNSVDHCYFEISAEDISDLEYITRKLKPKYEMHIMYKTYRQRIETDKGETDDKTI